MMERSRGKIGVLLWILFCFWNFEGTRAATYADPANSFNVTCNSAAECEMLNMMAECLLQVGSPDRTCACNLDDGFQLMEGKCVLQAELGEACDPGLSVCVDPNTECRYSGGFPFQICDCVSGTKRIKKADETYACGIELTTRMDPECQPCLDNQGTCYDVTGDSLRDGCHCLGSFSGDNCQTIHVNVTCEDDMMHICYEPHEGVNMSAGGHIQVVDTDRAECKGHLDTEGECDRPGLYRLEVDLMDSRLHICGTEKYAADKDTIKYQNLIAVYKNGDPNSDVILLKTYCVYTKYIRGGFMTAITEGGVYAEQGMQSSPAMYFEVRDVFGNAMSPSDSLRPGDMASFWITLDTSSGFTSMNVERCLFSTSHTLDNGLAEFVLITDDGCPADDQEYFDLGNNWRRPGNSVHVIHTGNVKMQRFRQGQNLYLHCSIKVCLEAYNGECVQKICYPSGRKKRASETLEIEEKTKRVEIVHTFYFANDQENTTDSYVIDKSTFITVICVIIAVIIITILFAWLAVRRSWCMTEQKPAENPPRVGPVNTIDLQQQNYRRFDNKATGC